MERRTVFLASIGALHVAACGGEPQDGYDEIQQAATSISPALLIKSISYAGTTEGSAMKLSVVVLPSLYLGTIILIKGRSGAATSGTFAIGSPKKPSSAEATISPQLWDQIISDSTTYKLSIELDYNSNRTINEVYIEYI